MSDALPENENQQQTGEPDGQAGLSHAETKTETDGPSSKEIAPPPLEGAAPPPLEGAASPPSEQPALSAEAVVEPKPPYRAIKILVGLLIVLLFGFASVGFSETPYTSRHWMTTFFTGGGLLPKLFSAKGSVAFRAATDTAMGEFAANKSDNVEAEKYFVRALAEYKALNAQNTVCAHHCIVGLAKAYTEDKKDSEALEAWENALPIAEAVYGKEHEIVAGNMREIAFLSTRLRKYPEAEAYYDKALALDTKGLGPAHFDVGYDMSCVGEMAYLQKNYPKAIKYLSDSILIYKETRGEFHPSFFWVEESLAKAYYESSSYADAARQFESILARSDRLHGVPGKDYLRDLAWLTWAYYYNDNTERAVLRAKKLKKALDAKSDVHLSAMSDVLESDGDALMLVKEYDLAIQAYERFLKIERAKVGSDELRLTKTLYSIASCYEKLGNSEKADEYRSLAVNSESTAK